MMHIGMKICCRNVHCTNTSTKKSSCLCNNCQNSQDLNVLQKGL